MNELDREAMLSLLDSLGIEVTGETSQEWICYCVFHSNRDTPAFNIGKSHPWPWRCWNMACGASGTLSKLVAHVLELTPMQALRHINHFVSAPPAALDKILKLGAEADFAYAPASHDLLNRCQVDWNDPESCAPLSLLLERGFTREILIDYQIGYSKARNRITIPVFDENGDFLGFSGRATLPGQKPKYWDKGIPKKHILFNLDRAQKHDSVIMVEGPLDAIKVAQAGYENVVATFGGFFSIEQAKKLNRRFRRVILLEDNDEAGRALAESIVEVEHKAGKDIYFAEYPEGFKDPGDLNETQIREMIENKKSLLATKIKRLGA